ncbi:MAG: DUF6514 family protein [Oscillospiraceae bacterium]|nr:DUF6514 family protein [Oscillospiraceae bacterium]
MRTELYGNAIISAGAGAEARYSLLSEDAASAGPLGCELYGVQVEMGTETAGRPRLTASRASVTELLDRMVAGGVTPIGLGDVVDDWLNR